MGRYLKLAMTVISGQEPMRPAVALMATERKEESTLAHKVEPCSVKNSEIQDFAACGSPDCAGCYDVGDGKKIHPPKCGQAYSDWLKRWEPKGRKQ
jgi:hypothetical protein